MRTDELSIFGYCWTGSIVNARQPVSAMTRFTTTASTGCLMKTSVIARMSGAAVRDRDEGCVAELERARRRDPLTGGEPAQDHHVVPEHRPTLYRSQVRARFAFLVGGDDEDMVTGRPLAQRAHGDGHGRPRRPHRNTDAN